MLEHLSISNFAIIDDLQVSFASGLNTLTGETGAGKSIIIDALSLLQGERSSFDKIRHGKNKAFIEGVFSISNNEVKKTIEDLIDDEIEDSLIVSRSLDINGKTMIKINGHTQNIQNLKKIMNLILDIHSQQKDAYYLHEENQLKLLDMYISKVASKDELKEYENYQNEYKHYKTIKKDYDELLSKYNEIGSLDILNYQYEELLKANIQENEMENLEEERQKLSSFSKLSDKILEFISNYENASSSLYNAKKVLMHIDDDELSNLAQKFENNYLELDDIFQTIKDKYDEMSNVIYRLDQIQERLYFLHSLRRKYGYTTQDILNKFEEIKENIDIYSNFESQKIKYEDDIFLSKKKLKEYSLQITKIRTKYSDLLSKDINDQLKDLKLENAEFKVQISSSLDYDAQGNDTITFMLKANKGENFLSLAKTASLGETSRLNLALKIVFNQLNPKECIIFDEIDIGISGEAASSVAKKMKLISRTSQVISISHLPQVASAGDHQYLVKKEVIDDRTFSSIILLDYQERLEVIAKMISGDNINQTSMKIAEELIDSFK